MHAETHEPEQGYAAPRPALALQAVQRPKASQDTGALDNRKIREASLHGPSCDYLEGARIKVASCCKTQQY